MKTKYRINLSIFGEEEDKAAAEAARIAAEAANNSSKTEPFASFPDEKSFMTRMNREAKKQMSELLKTMGLENEDALKTILADKKAKEEADKTELQKLQDKLLAADIATKDAQNKANETLKISEARITGLSLGVKAERVDYLVRLLDLSSIEITDGVINKEALKVQIDKILLDMPELKGTSSNNNSSGKAGGEFKGGQNTPLSWDSIKKMNPKEAQARILEIREFMKNNPQ